MFKRYLLLPLLFLLFAQFVKAQNAEDIYNAYTNFNTSVVQGQSEIAIKQGEQLMPNANKLPLKSQTKFYYFIGNLYENNKQFDKAMPCYQKVVAAEPDYYVARLAIGYLYMKNVTAIGAKLNLAKTDFNENKRLAALYNAEVRKALPHLEKAQACDPSDQTLTLIKMLYKNIKDEQGLKSLDGRLANMSKTCVDLLTDN